MKLSDLNYLLNELDAAPTAQPVVSGNTDINDPNLQAAMLSQQMKQKNSAKQDIMSQIKEIDGQLKLLQQRKTQLTQQLGNIR